MLDAKQTRPSPVIERVWLRETTLEVDRVDRDRFKVDSSADRIDVDWIRIHTLERTGLYIAYYYYYYYYYYLKLHSACSTVHDTVK